MRCPIRIIVLTALSLRSAAAQTPPYRFSDVAFIGAGTCPTNYSRVDDCANEYNPPAPSIRRNVVVPIGLGYSVDHPLPTYGGAPPFLRTTFPLGLPTPGKPEPLPDGHTTADGRLLLRLESISHGESPLEAQSKLSFVPYRPENVRHDWKSGAAGTLPQRFRDSLPPLVWLDPRDTRWTNLNPPSGRPSYPRATHSTICETGDVAVEADKRSPRACNATYDNAVYQGDCYDLTLIINTYEDPSWNWEMRSVDLTVFVPSAKRPDTGESGGGALPDGRSTLVYPRMPRPKVGGAWILPEWKWKDVAAFPQNMTRDEMGYNPDPNHSWSNLLDRVRLCETMSLANRPNWCAFFDRQRRRTFYNIDDNDDANMDPPPGAAPGLPGAHTRWSGTPIPDKNLYLFEPITTGDGHLLISTVDGVMYSYSENPCDIGGWNNFYPISHMPHDPNLLAHYEIARAQIDPRTGAPQPFRDSLGQPIPFGAHDYSAYPWIDRAGKNLIYALGNNSRDGYLAWKVKDGPYDKYPAPPPATMSDVERKGRTPDRGPGTQVVVLGAWTQGKQVILDNSVNFTDFGRGPSWHYTLRLYADTDITVAPKGSQNLNSFENRMFLYDAHNPVLPFDVVWMLHSDNLHNAEIVFDEYHNNRAFVVAHMNAPVEYATGWPVDGFVAANPGPPEHVGSATDFRFTKTPLLQNAAGGTKWHAADGVEGPATLSLRGGARVEPVSMGGVLGKGVYLDGENDFIDMSYPIDPALRETGWYLGLWIDPRDDPKSAIGAQRTIFYFPDRSSIGLQRMGAQYRATLRHAPTGRMESVMLPRVQTGRYFHFGVRIDTRLDVPIGQRGTRATRELRIFVDGTPVGGPVAFVMADYKDGSGVLGFQPMAGTDKRTSMAVGEPNPSVEPGQGRRTLKAWVDELRIYALRAEDGPGTWFDELICNTALGTLVDVAGTSADPRVTRLQAIAGQYPGKPNVLCEQLLLKTYNEPLDFPPQYGQLLCADRQHKNPDPVEGGRCLRRQRLGIAGPAHALRPDQPRPDFSQVAFCKSCHVDNHPLRRHNATGQPIPGGLDLDALDRGGLAVPRMNDRRRQPMNVPATLSGRWPSWWPVSPNPAPQLDPMVPDVFLLDPVFDLGSRIAPNP